MNTTHILWKNQSISIEEAVRLKFAEGRRVFGEEWHGGLRPVEQAFGEVVDALVYVKLELGPTGLAGLEAEPAPELSGSLSALYDDLFGIAERLREILVSESADLEKPFELPRGRFGDGY